MSELLSAYVDGVLDGSTRVRVEEHITACAECAAELQALKGYLEEVRSLERLQAPPDFLEKIHERLEQSSPLKRIVHKLFLPVRFKVPLELAGVLAATLLVVFTYHGLKSEKTLTQVPQTLPQQSMQLAQKGNGVAADMESDRPLDMLRESKSIAPVETAKPIQLALLLRPAAGTEEMEGGGSTAPGATSLSAPMPAPQRESQPQTGSISLSEPAAKPPPPENQATDSRDEKAHSVSPRADASPFRAKAKTAVGRYAAEAPMKKVVPSPQPAPAAEPAAAVDPNEALVRVRKSLLSLEAKILRVDHARKTRLPAAVVAEIPSRNYPALLDKLRLLGELRETPGAEVTSREPEVMQVRIEIVPAK